MGKNNSDEVLKFIFYNDIGVAIPKLIQVCFRIEQMNDSLKFLKTSSLLPEGRYNYEMGEAEREPYNVWSELEVAV